MVCETYSYQLQFISFRRSLWCRRRILCLVGVRESIRVGPKKVERQVLRAWGSPVISVTCVSLCSLFASQLVEGANMISHINFSTPGKLGDF